MINRLKLFIIISALVTIAANTVTPPPPVEEFKNLKVLPKNITDEQLDSVMDNFKASLGVNCSFCHAAAKDTSVKRHLDFASDEKPTKLRAREMMQMTAYLNENYFNPEHSSQPDTIHQVICYTCHRGFHEPDADLLFPQVDSIMKAQHQRKK